MIIDLIKNVCLYTGIHPGLCKVICFLQGLYPEINTGRYDIDGNDIYALVQEPVQTQYEDTDLEFHRKYIDMHIVLKGHEYIGMALVKEQETTVAYDESKDILFCKDNRSSKIYLEEGMFCFIWPHEGHKPNCYLDTPCNARKVVIKLRIDKINK